MTTKNRKQAEFGFTNWGGRRRGSGRKRAGERSRVTHARRSKLSAHTPVHVTLRLATGLPNLRTRANHRVVLDALAAGSRSGLRVVHYAALSNHLHLVCEARDQCTLARGLQGLCVRLARRLNRVWRRVGRVFGDRYHAHALHTPREVRNAIAYVLGNAAKHGVSIPGGVDPCSSGRWFDGWRVALVGALARVAPLPAPRTWLLRVGWRRGGLIDLQACARR
ncbi:MAG: hypothetical protein JNL28_11600 [Planctomycetes bacterium]|nr:hypothetical protein [Planctomycetota bacterium]